MDKKSQISGRQLVAILLASRLATSLNFVPTLHQSSHGTDFILSALLQIPLLALAFIPVWLFSRRTHGASILDYSNILLGKGGLVIAGLYGLVSLYIQMDSLLRFNHFVSIALSPDMPLTILCIVLVAAAFLAALHGLQAIARTATVIAATVVGATVFICIALIPEMKTANFPPLLYQGISPVIAGAIEEFPRTLEIVSIALIFPYVKGSVVKSYFTWSVVLAAVVIVIQISVAGVLGDYADMVLFPYYMAVTAAQIGVLQRVDIIATAVWMSALLIKMAFFAMIFMSCMQRIFGEKRKLLYAIAGALLVLVPGIMLGGSPLFEERFVVWFISAGIMAAFVVLLPLLLLLLDTIRYKKTHPKGHAGEASAN